MFLLLTILVNVTMFGKHYLHLLLSQGREAFTALMTEMKAAVTILPTGTI